MLVKKHQAQATLEYAILIAAVVGAILFMSQYMKRAVEGKIHKEADSVGSQFDIQKGNYKYISNLAANQKEVTYSATGNSSGNASSVLGELGQKWIKTNVNPGQGSQVQYTENAAARVTNEVTNTTNTVSGK